MTAGKRLASFGITKNPLTFRNNRNPRGFCRVCGIRARKDKTYGDDKDKDGKSRTKTMTKTVFWREDRIRTCKPTRRFSVIFPIVFALYH